MPTPADELLPLPDALRATHAVVIEGYGAGEVRPWRVQAQRRSDGVADGPIRIFYADGARYAEGAHRDGSPTGPWRWYTAKGELFMTAEHHGDGTRTTRYVGPTMAAAGTERLAHDGTWQREGWWRERLRDDVWIDAEYLHGRRVRARPSLDALREGLDGGAVSDAVRTLAGGSVETAYEGVDALLATGWTLSPDTAVALALAGTATTLHRVIPWFAAMGAHAWPAVQRSLTTRGAPTHALAHAVMLTALQRPLDATWDGLFAAALFDTTHAPAQRALVAHFTDALLALPVERRAALVLGAPSHPAPHRTRPHWTYAATAPTPAVIDALLAEVAMLPAATLAKNPARRDEITATLCALARHTVAPFCAWLEGEGRRAKHRALALHAAAAAQDPVVVPTLLSFAHDTQPEARDAARSGLTALGDAARGPLTLVAAGRRGRARDLAHTLLTALDEGVAARR